jgi:cytochrome c553
MTTKFHNPNKELSMKKTMFVMTVAAALILALAASASAYVSWSTGNAANAKGPHADYQTASTKCGVCHAVHGAAVSGKTGTDYSQTGAPVSWTATTGPTEMLLRSSVADSCRYCHIDTAIGGVQLYQSSTGSVYGTWGGPGHKGSSSSACVSCHAVHGANTYKGANEAKILRLAISGTKYPQPDVIGSGNPNINTRNPAIQPLFTTWAQAQVSNRKYEQQSAFCSSCHTNYSSSADATIAKSGKNYDDPSAANLSKTHSMVIASSSFTSQTAGVTPVEDVGGVVTNSAAGTALGATTGAGNPVAFKNSTACRSCHDAGSTDQTGVSMDSFPHYIQGTLFFLNTASDAAATGAGATDSFADGTCLKCHRNGTGSGVGLTF